MGKKYIVGVDGGSQSTKVLIFDLEGNIVCQATQSLRAPVSRQEGYVEHPDDDLWDSLVIAGNQAMEKFAGNPSDILGLGLCTIRCCRAFLKEDGSLNEPVMSWMDIRSYKPFQLGSGTKYATTTTGYMTHRLTGNFCDTFSNNIYKQWPIDPEIWDWSEDPQKYIDFNISRENLFKLQMPGTILGYLTGDAARATGFPAGIPVVATANDKAVEALGAGIMGSDIGLVSLGTYIPTMVSGSRFVKTAQHYYTNLGCVPHQYIYESSGIRRGMWTVSWLRDLLGDEVKLKAQALGISPEQFLDREAELIPPGSEGLMTVPEWLMPANQAYKKGMMLGFDVRHTRAHMHRSIMEGIAMTMKTKYQAMCDELGIHPKKIIVSGGGSSGDIFMRIFADVFGIPAMRNHINGAAGLGAAICVAVATGVYDSFESAAAKMVKIRDEFEPVPENHVLYTRLNEEIYQHITSHTDEIFKKSFSIL